MSKRIGKLGSLVQLFKSLLGTSSARSRSKSVKPWHIYENQAKQQEDAMDYEEAIMSYKEAPKELSAYFEPFKADNKYFTSKKSEIKFKIDCIQQNEAIRLLDTKVIKLNKP